LVSIVDVLYHHMLLITAGILYIITEYCYMMALTKKLLVTVGDSTKPIELTEPITTASLHKVHGVRSPHIFHLSSSLCFAIFLDFAA